MAYIGKSPSVGVRDRFYYTASGGETSISGNDDAGRSLVFTDGKYVDVSLNGVTLVAGTDYVTTTTNTISSLDALSASDIVEVVVYDVFSVADTVSASRGGRFQEAVIFDKGITVSDSVSATAFYGDGSNLTGIVSTFDALTDTNLDSVAHGHGVVYDSDTSKWILTGSSTGAFQLPSGTTAEQPTPVAGMLRFNTETNTIEVYNGTAWGAVAGGGGAGLQDIFLLMGA